MSNTLLSIFQDKQRANQTAVIIPSSCPTPAKLTYAQLFDAVTDFANQLLQQVPDLTPGSAVAISYVNSLEFTIAFLATGLLRLVSAPLNPNYTEDEFNFYLEDSKAKAMIVPPGSIQNPKHAAVLAARKQGTAVVEAKWTGNAIQLQGPSKGRSQKVVFEPQPDDITLLLHTSGTTGRPKGIRSVVCEKYTQQQNNTMVEIADAVYVYAQASRCPTSTLSPPCETLSAPTSSPLRTAPCW